MTRWKGQFIVKGYVSFPEPISTYGVEFICKERVNFATVIVEAENEDKAIEIATAKVEFVLAGISFVTGNKAIIEIHNIWETDSESTHKHGSSFISGRLGVSHRFTLSEKDSVEEFLTIIGKSDKTAEKAYKHYLRGLHIEGWNSEAFLNFFKAIEEIANKYFTSAHAAKLKLIEKEEEALLDKLNIALNTGNKSKALELIKEIYKLGQIVIKQKIETALEDLDMIELKKRMFELTDKRHSIAHPGKDNITDEQLQECKELSKKIILKYLQKLSH